MKTSFPYLKYWANIFVNYQPLVVPISPAFNFKISSVGQNQFGAKVHPQAPYIENGDSLSELSGAKWYNTLDLASGYWQVPAGSGKAAL